MQHVPRVGLHSGERLPSINCIQLPPLGRVDQLHQDLWSPLAPGILPLLLGVKNKGYLECEGNNFTLGLYTITSALLL